MPARARRAIAMDAMADPADPPERLDIDVQQIAGAGHSYRCTGTGGAAGGRFSPKRRSQALTVDRGTSSARPIAQAGSPCCCAQHPNQAPRPPAASDAAARRAATSRPRARRPRPR